MTDLYSFFNLRRGDPFLAAPRFDWRGLRSAVNRLRDAARRREWTLVYGPPGSGKTEALREFRARCDDDFHVVEVQALARRQLRMAALTEACFLDLRLEDIGERPARGRESKVRQLVRLFGIREMERPILLVLDEASLFSQDVLNDIKHLRDLRWSGRPDKADRRPHFGVAMFGWASLAKRVAAVRQNQIRVRTRKVLPMSQNELAGFLEHVGLARIVPEDTRAVIPANARYPGVVEYLLKTGMERAAEAGRRVVAPEDVGSVDARGLDELRAELKRLDIRQREIARAAGLANATVNLILSGKYNGAETTRLNVITAAWALVEDSRTDQSALSPRKRKTA